jgi:RecB family endonuclease NucS
MSETQYCTPLLVSDDNVSVLERIPISDGGYNEAYIQDLAFAHPSCLPISELDRTYEGLIPVCKELNTPAGPLDILYVTPQGRLVIVEAKL